jgi:hypothetical protein
MNSRILPWGLMLAAVYFLVAGVGALIWLRFGPSPSHPQFEGKSFAFKLGSYFREGVINITFIIAGLSILGRQSWAPSIAYIALAVGTFYTSHQFAWGFASGPPPSVLVGSFVAVAAWNALWGYLVFCNRAAP